METREKLVFLSAVACAPGTSAQRQEAHKLAVALKVPFAFNSALYLMHRGERPRESSVRRVAKQVAELV